MTYGRLCDYLIRTDSYVYAGVCVDSRSHRHDADSLKIGRHNRMLPMCRVDIFDILATDKNVCPLRGGADRHKSQHCQPRPAQRSIWGPYTPSTPPKNISASLGGCHPSIQCIGVEHKASCGALGGIPTSGGWWNPALPAVPLWRRSGTAGSAGFHQKCITWFDR